MPWVTFPRLWRMCSEEKLNAAQLFPSPQSRSFLYILYISRANAAVITWGMMLAMMQMALFPLCFSYQSKTLRMTKPIQLSYVGMERLMLTTDCMLLGISKYQKDMTSSRSTLDLGRFQWTSPKCLLCPTFSLLSFFMLFLSPLWCIHAHS